MFVITTPTLFILGAGASVDYGFPTGDELWRGLAGQRRYLQRWAYSPELPSTLSYTIGPSGLDKEEWAAENKRVLEFQKRLRQSQLKPVDRFAERLEANRNDYSSQDLKYWKLLVAQHILERERAFHEAFMASTYNEKRSTTDLVDEQERQNLAPWFSQLFTKMATDCDSLEGFRKSNKVAFWTFNYDRILERLFHDALSACYSDQGKRSEGAKVVGDLTIWHIHGQVGHYADASDKRNQSTGPDVKSVAFGDLSGAAIKEAASQLVLAHSEIPEKILNSQNRKLEAFAGKNGPLRVVFLGFGFDRLNVKKLDLFNLLKSPGVNAFATVREPTPASTANVLNDLGIDKRNQRHDIRSLIEALDD